MGVAERASGRGPTASDAGVAAAAAAAAAALCAARGRTLRGFRRATWALAAGDGRTQAVGAAADGPVTPRGGSLRVGPGQATTHGHDAAAFRPGGRVRPRSWSPMWAVACRQEM